MRFWAKHSVTLRRGGSQMQRYSFGGQMYRCGDAEMQRCRGADVQRCRARVEQAHRCTYRGA